MLNLKQFCIDTLSFATKNVLILCLFAFFAFSASFLSLKYAFKHHTLMLISYSIFCYFFYYVFISFYFEQKPLFTSEKIVNSLIKLVVIFAVSLFVIICGHLFLELLKYMARWLIGFPDIYTFLKKFYLFLNASSLGRFLLCIPVIFLLTFTFFIPGFAWISTLNGGDQSLLSSYIKTHGSYIKIALILFVLFGLFPFISSLVTRQTPLALSFSHALLTIFQITFYLRLYDFFYKRDDIL